MQPPPPGAQPPPPQYGYQPGFGPPQYAAQAGWAPPPYWSPPPPQGPRRSVRTLGWIGVAIAVLGVIGSRIRWAEVRGFASAGVYVPNPEIDGRELGVGAFCLVLFLAIGALSAVLVWRTVLGCAIAVLSIGPVLLIVTALNVFAVDQIAGPSVERYGLTASIGAGLWLSLAAAIGASAVGLLAVIRANTRVAPPSRWDAPPIAPYRPHP